ncbi:MAG: hypothetical protein H6711_03430 [Myxococcales bacterium]|nr:hypothetical protein [Myxococcales bacterium]
MSTTSAAASHSTGASPSAPATATTGASATTGESEGDTTTGGPVDFEGVDLLLVIDSSGSMAEEQAKLAGAISARRQR